jgi:hypothetical protein
LVGYPASPIPLADALSGIDSRTSRRASKHATWRPGRLGTVKAIVAALCLGLLVAAGCAAQSGSSSSATIEASLSPSPAISAEMARAVALREEPGADVQVRSVTLTTYGAASPNGGVRPASTQVWAVLLSGTFPPFSCGPYSPTPHPCPSPATSALILIDAQTGEFIEAQIPGGVEGGASGGPGSTAPTLAPTVAPTDSTGPVESTTQNDLFRLTIRAGRATYRTDEAIAPVEAVLTYTGTQPDFAAWGAAGGPVSFSLRQLDGPLHQEATSDDVCGYQLMTPGETITVSFMKSGGFDPAASDGDFWSRYFADPDLHLPVGRWLISAALTVYGPECRPPNHFLTTSIEVQVVP